MPASARLVALLALLGAAAPAFALDVVSVDPVREALTADVTTTIRVTFDRPVDAATLSKATFRAYGRWSGPADGARTLSADGLTVTLTPTLPFSAGELVHVNLSNGLRGVDATPLRSAGYAFRFHTRTEPAAQFDESHRASVRDQPANRVLLYGGLVCDLERDGSPDLLIVNEGTGDIRILDNMDDGSATFAPFRTPPTPIGTGSSPSEADDFDQDGVIDVVTANHGDDNITVVFGDGAGGFLPTLAIDGVSDSHGMAILDVDGDGDRDIVATSRAGNGMRLIRNEGNRTFGAVESFEGGASGEWGLSTADMNGDGIYDLVVGFIDSEQVNVLLGNGDGTFTAGTPVDVVGDVWMVDTGDVNGDGHVDVAATTSSPGGGVLLLGDGAGGLGAPQPYARLGHTPATDFGDVDGDGDLDWVLSLYGARRWRLLENDGSGGFSTRRDFSATRNPGCAIAFDADADGDLDLALLDEVNDEVIVMQNGPVHVRAALAPTWARLVLPDDGARITPRLTARGTIHFGPDVEDLTADVDVTIGARTFRTELTRTTRRGRRLVFEGDSATLRLDTPAPGRSRGTFFLSARDDLTGDIDVASDVLVEFASKDFEAGARLDLETGRFRLAQGAPADPPISLARLRATLVGGGSDRCSVTLLVPGLDTAPAEAPTLSVEVGDFRAVLPSASFAFRRGAFRLTTPTDGVRRATYDPLRGRVTLVARDVELGAYEEGPLTVTFDSGEGPRLVTVTPSKRGRRVVY